MVQPPRTPSPRSHRLPAATPNSGTIDCIRHHLWSSRTVISWTWTAARSVRQSEPLVCTRSRSLVAATTVPTHCTFPEITLRCRTSKRTRWSRCLVTPLRQRWRTEDSSPVRYMNSITGLTEDSATEDKLEWYRSRVVQTSSVGCLLYDSSWVVEWFMFCLS